MSKEQKKHTMRRQTHPASHRQSHWHSGSLRQATFRFSLLLIFATLLLLPIATPDAQQLLLLGGLLVVYSAAVLLVHTLQVKQMNARRQAWMVSLIMLLFVLVAGWLFRNPVVMFALFVPVIYASLLLDGKLLSAVVVLSACALIVLQMLISTPEPSAWPALVVGLIPLVLIAMLISGLRLDLIQARNRVTALSYQDELAGTLNMRAFTRLLQAAHTRAEQGGQPYALMMIDIQGLQAINENFGHEQGNRVIVAVAEALIRSVRKNDLVARYGGDEFIIYLDAADLAVAQETSNRVTQNVYNITLSFDRKMQRVQVNAGTSVYPENATSIQELMTFADKAMYKDKLLRRKLSGNKEPDADSRRAQAGLEDY